MTSTYPILGVGRLIQATDDLRLAQADAARYILAVIRNLAKLRHPDDLGDLDPIELITQAERFTYHVGKSHLLQMYVLPMPWQIEVPDEWIAWFTGVTSQWKRGREPLIAATEAVVDQVLQRFGIDPTPTQIERRETLPDHWPYFFAYHIAVKRASEDGS